MRLHVQCSTYCLFEPFLPLQRQHGGHQGLEATIISRRAAQVVAVDVAPNETPKDVKWLRGPMHVAKILTL
ncbi:hypothetical protein B6U99_06240 [Candidatus Geothermarchaeota archaeon ex4572_27]|nr:MAG: hypothetical protein B6U99_06240 [Candidatus Geothermarchaeota archaeon ex4572_27]